MVATLRDDTSALSTVQKWAAEFRNSFEDDSMSGHLATVTPEENMVTDDWQVIKNQKQKENPDVIRISCERELRIFCTMNLA